MLNESFHIFAPAKINLFLHLTGKTADGYHTLQSLMTFVDVGDELVFSAQKDFQVEVKGPFLAALPPEVDNLIYKAARLLAEEYKVPLQGKITLTKNLPIASGIGGGSADAAAALKGLAQLWNLPRDEFRLLRLAKQLGADVPPCLASKTVWAEGIGEKLTYTPAMPALYFVLVNPLVPTATAAVFKKFRGDFSPSMLFPGMKGMNVTELAACRNDLTAPACEVTPVITAVLAAIAATDDCLLQRLSGSGATCFGIYKTVAEAVAAADTLKKHHPTWWVMPTQQHV